MANDSFSFEDAQREAAAASDGPWKNYTAPAPSRDGPWNQYAGQKSGSFSFEEAQGSPENQGGAISDLGKSLKVGVQRLPGVATGLADLPVALATGARPFTKMADYVGEKTGFQPGKWADETKFSQGYEQSKQAVDQAWDQGGVGNIAKAYLTNPGYTANQVVESLPSMVAGGLAGRALMGAGAVAGRAATATQAARKAVPGALERAVGEKAATAISAGAGEGVVTAGQQMQQVTDGDQQKNALAALGAGAATGAIGGVAGRAARAMGLETAETALVNAGRRGAVHAADEVPLSAKRRILGGMVSEAVLQELPQSAQEQMWQNWAEGKPLMDGVARQAVEGSLAGAAMGAGANVSDGGAGKRRVETEKALQRTLDAIRSAEELARQNDPHTAPDWTTSAGAADPNAEPATGTASVANAPGVVDAGFTTSPGAAPAREAGVDFTRDVDTSGLSLQDPAEVERERASRIDYVPGDTTPQWATTAGAAPESQPGLDMPPPTFDTGDLSLDMRTPSQRMGIDPAAGPLSKAATMAVDSGAHAQMLGQQAQQAQFLGATGRDIAPRRTGPGLNDDSNVIDVQGRVIDEPAIGTPRRLTTQESAQESGAQAFLDGVPRAEIAAIPNVVHRASQLRGYDEAARQASTPALPAPRNVRNGLERIRAQRQLAAQAAQSPHANPTGAVSHGPQADQAQQGGTQQPQARNQEAAGRAAAPAGAAAPNGGSGVQADGLNRPQNWRTSMLRAGPVARAMGLQTKGKRLAQVVAEIDAADARRAGVPQDGTDLSAGRLNRAWSVFAPETGSLGVPRDQMPQIKAEHRGALVNFLKARGIDSRAEEVPANDLKPTQAEFSPAKVEKARAFKGGDRSILVSSDGYVVDGHHQWLAKRANGEPVKVIRLKAPIQQVLQQVAQFPSTTAAGTNLGTSHATARDLRLADERAPGAGAAASHRTGESVAGAAPAVGAGQRPGDRSAQPAPSVPSAVSGAGSASEPAAGVGQAAASAPKKRPRGILAKKAEAEEKARAGYFTPGNVVAGYGGAHHRVVSYQPSDADGRWSVTVRAVRKEGGTWVDVPGERERNHATQPDAKELKAGPVGRVQSGEDGKVALFSQRGTTHDVTTERGVVGNKDTGRPADDATQGAIDEDTGLPLNADGTVTVYHHTNAKAAAVIRRTGMLKADAEPDVYVTTRRETDTGYGDTAVAVRVNPARLQIDDEFPNGRKDFRLSVGRPGGSIRVAVSNEPSASARSDAVRFSRSGKPASLAEVRAYLDAQGVEHTLSESRGVLTVGKVVVPEGQRASGVGTAAMQAITAYADAAGLHVALSPSADFGGNKARLAQFYKRFGFKENKGRAKVYEVSETMVRENPQGRMLFSRSASTKAAYEARVDALFAGEPAGRVGVKVLDHSDVLGLLGFTKLPLILRESKVVKGQSSHPAMTAAQWKKVPQWIENPAAVFDSDTVPGALVFVAPELVNGSVALVTVEPDSTVSATLMAHEVTNAYDKDNGSPPLARWLRDGLARYVDQKEFPAVASRAGLQLSGKAFANKPGTPRILTEKNLTGWRRENNPQHSFAGQQAATADKLALATAQERLGAGEDAETVRQDTGWSRGVDGKWRFEISDEDARLALTPQEFRTFADGGRTVSLGDLLEHPALFAAYPALRDMPVGSKPGAGASYSPRAGQISMGREVADGRFRSILLHEIQHDIQTIEGFATGASVSQYRGGISARREQYRREAGEVEARNTQTRMDMSSAERRAFPPDMTADVAPGDQIVTFNGKVAAHAPAPANGAMSSELARQILALQPKPATKESVQAAVRQLVGIGMLPNRLGRVVVATSSEIKQDWEPIIGKTGMEASGEAGQAQGFYDPKTKTVFLIADHINAGDELGVVAHELMHKHGQAVLGEEGWNTLHSVISGWAKAEAGSMERRVYAEAAARVRQSRPSDADVDEYSSQELFPYAVQVALELGVKPNAFSRPGTVAKWLAQVKLALRDVWKKVTGTARGEATFKSQDLVNLAFGIAQRENPAHAGELDGALRFDGDGQKALAEFAKNDELFALPKSTKDTIEGIAKDNDPTISVRVTRFPGNETMYTLTLPGGDGTARITVRKSGKDSVYGARDAGEKGHEWEVGRPGENPQDVPVGTEDVWIDVSALKPGQNGSMVYNIAATFAHNTGRVFIGDPSGVSAVAMRRRLENMLSSALKFGTTRHIAPHPDQVRGRDGVPPLKWVYGDDVGNVNRMMQASVKALDNAFPESKLVAYDPERGFYRTDAPEGAMDRRQLATVLGRSTAEYRVADGAGATGQAGWRTVARAALYRYLGSHSATAGDGAGTGMARGSPQLSGLHSDGSTGALGSAEERKSRIFYSRSVAATSDDYSPAQARAAERVFGVQKKQTLAERAQAMRANLGTKLRQGLVDQFAPIKEVSEKAYILARLSKGSDGAVEAAMLYGKPYLRDGVADVDIKDGGFAKVLASLKGEEVRFFQWVAAHRAERLKAEGKENLLTQQDISDLKTLNAGRMADGTPRLGVYAQALRELNAFNEAALKVAMESGLMDQAAYDLMKDQPYVPFYRLMEDGDMRGPRFSSGLVNQQAWKKLKGGTQQLNADLLQNTLLNWSHLYAAAARNRASLETMAAAEKMGIAYRVSAETKGAVKVMRDGMAEHWAVEDPYLLDAISAMSYAPGGLVKAMAPFKRLLTFGVTVNPAFKIRNLIRDSLSAIAQADLSYNPLANVAGAWKASGSESQTYASMLASGGIIKFGTQENANRVRAQIERLGGEVLDQTGFGKLKGQMRSLWETYEEFGDRTENVNRVALYERLIAKGHSHAEASFMARDLMDFSMSGKWEVVRFLTQTVPFLNARLQGLYKLGRAAKEDPRRFAAMTGAVAMASMALMMAYSDDDDWKKREDWDRDTYWWFKIGDKAFRIPKPFEVGAIGTLAERTAELMFSKEMTGKRFGQRISDMVFNTFAMDPTPQFIKPFLDVYANKDSFSQRPIEGMADERLRPQDRFNERTSEVARLLGSWGLPDPVRLAKGEYSGLSPKQIDFLLRGYFGWLATVTTAATDAVVRPVLGRGERPAMRLRDAFLAGNFVENLPAGSSRYVTAMYEQARDVEQAWASYQAALKSGDTEQAQSIRESDGSKLRSRMALVHAKRQIAELGQQAKRIESNRLMSAEEKRRRLDEIEERKHRVAQRVAVTS